jgi:hypothetical protein
MNYTEVQLREIAKGRRLPSGTKLFIATIAVLLLLDWLSTWNGDRLIYTFLALGMFSYLSERLNALSRFVFKDQESEGQSEQRLV